MASVHPLSTESPAASLLSLSIAAASAQPIETTPAATVESTNTSNGFHGPSSLPSPGNTVNIANAKMHNAMKHRRLSSTGLTKRRLSDAREAATRPSAVSIQTAAAALSSLATLSLSNSPPPQAIPQTSSSFTSANGFFRFATSDLSNVTAGDLVKQEDEEGSTTHEVSVGGGISIKGTGKKRGTIFKCESCSKVYRHPSCLIKHRWEHSPHWREASKFLLSKHQQVQLLEAAAILSHLSPATGGTSLPEDRSLWPSFLSGGLLPPPAGTTLEAYSSKVDGVSTSAESPHTSFPVSSSVPAQSNIQPITRSTSTGPRMHDYSVPMSGLTQVRPGVVGVSTGSSPSATPSIEEVQIAAPRAVPVPVPVNNTMYRDRDTFASSALDSWGSPVSFTYAQSSYSGAHSFGTGGWSLPRSSLRSASVSDSRSRSGSAPKSDDEREDYVDIDAEDIPVDDGNSQPYGFISRGRMSATRHGWGDDEDEGMLLKHHHGHYHHIQKHQQHEEKIDEEWDGEMEMEM
ncbi:hypothetical protein ABKN59_008629 [Abortiporus biennis]